MTVQEKRTWLKNTVDTIDPQFVDRIYSYVINIDINQDTSSDNAPAGRRITHDELTKAITDVGKKYNTDLRRLSQ